MLRSQRCEKEEVVSKNRIGQTCPKRISYCCKIPLARKQNIRLIPLIPSVPENTKTVVGITTAPLQSATPVMYQNVLQLIYSSVRFNSVSHRAIGNHDTHRYVLSEKNKFRLIASSKICRNRSNVMTFKMRCDKVIKESSMPVLTPSIVSSVRAQRLRNIRQ